MAKMKAVFIGLIVHSNICLALAPYEGFFNPAEFHTVPTNNLTRKVFKVEIGPQSHGTAFALAKDVLVTNVHNITECLRDHGLVDTGYDGARGPLPCDSLTVLDTQSQERHKVLLLGSNSRTEPGAWDFAVIRAVGLTAIGTPLRASEIEMNKEVFVVGFPGETYRGKSLLQKKRQELIEAFDILFEAADHFESIDPEEHSSQAIFSLWSTSVFQKLQPMLSRSNFLSGSLMGRTQNPLLTWQRETSQKYLRTVLLHLNELKKDMYIVLSMVERGLATSAENYPDADGNIKISRAELHRIDAAGTLVLQGDATPGSSGSMVLDEAGHAAGIVFQIMPVQQDEKSLCVLDAMMSDFESINFMYCNSFGLGMVPGTTILSKIQEWKIGLDN
jgi:hypothetical protein